MHHDQGERQALAVTLGLLLLIGGVLLVDAWAGYWVALTTFCAPVVAGYAFRPSSSARAQLRSFMLRRALRRALRNAVDPRNHGSTEP
ncbi:hypothetical protein AB0D73_35300 [Streptomyces sp. NPDC048215]|uniref:hypothetical protein n=1 Tax=unclassified Streptomyces TaxID=2593676 RepID=UPI0033D8E304